MMFKSYLSALPRFLVALLLVLFIAGCETFNTSPDPKPNKPLPEPESCSSSNNELERAEASDIELILACNIINHEEQQRPKMHYHPTLGEIARMRAEDMAENGYYGGDREYPPHVDHDGYGPNHYLCEAGYRTDLYCSDDPYRNNVESIVAGYREVEDVLYVWYSSEGHRVHVLGEREFYANSNYYGVGHAVGERGGSSPDDSVWTIDFWVFIAAYPPEETNMISGSGSY